MTIRCKFKVDQIDRINSYKSEKQPDGSYKNVPFEMRSVKMSPVYGNGDPSHENTKFWQASPSGQFTLGTVNLTAVDSLELGGEYYIDIVPAPKVG